MFLLITGLIIMLANFDSATTEIIVITGFIISFWFQAAVFAPPNRDILNEKLDVNLESNLPFNDNDGGSSDDHQTSDDKKEDGRAEKDDDKNKRLD